MTDPYWVSDCGSATIYCGDCLEVLRSLPEKSVDAVVTDPPYSSGGQFRSDRMRDARDKYVRSDVMHALPTFTGDNLDQRSYLAWCSLWLSASRRCCTAGAMVSVFSDWRQLPITTDAVQCAGFVWRGIGVWDKKNARPAKGRYAQQAEFAVWGSNGPRPLAGVCGRGVWTCATPKASSRQHITQKPVHVLESMLEVVDSGGAVLDPFMGSGTTGVACVNTGRRFVGVELDEGYCNIARRRIEEALSARKEAVT